MLILSGKTIETLTCKTKDSLPEGNGQLYQQNTMSQKIDIALKGFDAKQVTGRILTSLKVQDHNTFENPMNVAPKAFKNAYLSNGNIKVNMPPNSVIVLELDS